MDIYYRDEEVSVELELVEGQVFAHLFLKKLTPTLLKKMQEGLSHLLATAEPLGYEYIFLTSRNRNKVKLWETIRPLDELKLVDGIYLGAWATGDS